jgi:hypothetical protein
LKDGHQKSIQHREEEHQNEILQLKEEHKKEIEQKDQQIDHLTARSSRLALASCFPNRQVTADTPEELLADILAENDECLASMQHPLLSFEKVYSSYLRVGPTNSGKCLPSWEDLRASESAKYVNPRERLRGFLEDWAGEQRASIHRKVVPEHYLGLGLLKTLEDLHECDVEDTEHKDDIFRLNGIIYGKNKDAYFIPNC